MIFFYLIYMLVNKKLILFFIAFKATLINAMTTIVTSDQINESNAVKAPMVHFYNLSKKALIPRINITKSFKFLDLYVGSSIGYDLFFYNRNNFKFGLLSARLDFINTFMDIIIVHNQCKISKFRPWAYNEEKSFKLSIAVSLLNNLIISLFNFKIHAFTIHWIEIRTSFIFLDLPSLCRNYELYERDKDYEKMHKRIVAYLISDLLIPSLQIDILELVKKKAY